MDTLLSKPKRPTLLGADLHIYPYLSGYGLLQRICRLMMLDQRELISSLGLRLREGADLLALTQRPSRVRDALCELVGINVNDAQSLWSPEDWSPLQTGGALDRLCRQLRQCPECAKHGYHTALFQLPSIRQCPWHKSPLIDACPKCHRPLDALYARVGRIGACRCGRELFDVDTASVHMRRFPTLHAKGWLDTYRRWAGDRRRTKHLLIPEHDVRWRHLYARQAAPPDSPPSDVSLELEIFRAGNLPEPPARECWAWCLLGSDRPLTYVPLPDHVHTMLSTASEYVALRLPAGYAKALELATPVASGTNRAITRSDHFIAPFGRSETGETWLNVSAVEPRLLWFCGRLIDQVITVCGEQPNTEAKSLQAARSDALKRIPGRVCLVRALEQLLRRGYMQGLDAVLRTHYQYAIPSRTKWWLPAVELEAHAGGLDSVSITWLEISAPALRRTAESPKADQKRTQRRQHRSARTKRVKQRASRLRR